MRKIVLLIFGLILACSKPTTEVEDFNVLEIEEMTEVSDASSARGGTLISVEGGSLVEYIVTDSKGNVTGYNYRVTAQAGYRLVAFNREGLLTYEEGDLISSVGRLSGFVFSEMHTFTYKGRVFDVEKSLNNISEYKRQWDLVLSAASGRGDALDYDTRFVILQNRAYYFGAVAVDDFTVYNETFFESGVILHEIGHVWSVREGSPVNWDEWRAIMSENFISNYGATNVYEYFAEAFGRMILPSTSVPKAVEGKLGSYGL